MEGAKRELNADEAADEILMQSHFLYGIIILLRHVTRTYNYIILVFPVFQKNRYK